MMFLFIFLCGLFYKITSGDVQFLENIEQQCILRCQNYQNNSEDGAHPNFACDDKCKHNQCIIGCNLWRQALNSSCQESCYSEDSSLLTPKDHYCVIGCKEAVSSYYSTLPSLLGSLLPPVLVKDSVDATSIKLQWEVPKEVELGLMYFMQCKPERYPYRWEYCKFTSWDPGFSFCNVEHLEPLTKYTFRVALLSKDGGPACMFSNVSAVISTLSADAVSSSFLSVRGIALDSNRISISWVPGHYTHENGQSYILHIEGGEPSINYEVKDIPLDVNEYIFRNLTPKTSYNVTVKVQNQKGDGPSSSVSIYTPPRPIKLKETKKPILILGTKHSVIEQSSNIMEEPTTLFQTNNSILGVAVHIPKQLLFVSQNDNTITRKHISNVFNDIKFELNLNPLDLTVDWLNDHLYILGRIGHYPPRWHISRCDLEGRNFLVILEDLLVQPTTLEVDPFNGFLFWSNENGLFRIDLATIPKNHNDTDITPEQIIKDSSIGSFTVDHTNFKILVTSNKETTVYAYTLDGKEKTNLRPNVSLSRMHNIISLAVANDTFFWTDGSNIYHEIYNGKFIQYEYPELVYRSYKKVIMNLESSQPTPVPVNAPGLIQAISSSNYSVLSWKAPILLGVQGKGAWCNWSYEVSVKNLNTSKEETLNQINKTTFTLENLHPSTRYQIKTKAYTDNGSSPWSENFITQTLPNHDIAPFIIWSSPKGLQKTDITGQNSKTLVHGNKRNYAVTDITWYKDSIYMISNTSHLYWYNITSRKEGKITDSVTSIAVDWIGRKLYWSNPKQQIIIRANLNGSQQEQLPFVALVKELNIDSIKAYIYWTNGYAIECSLMNGENKMEYDKEQLFSGKQVMGLTLDSDERNIYWIARGSDGSTIFRAPMAGYDTTIFSVQKVGDISHPVLGSLNYFSNRLLWLQDDKRVAISDLDGENIAVIEQNDMELVSVVGLIDQSLRKIPGSNLPLEKINVIPEPIDMKSIIVNGSSEKFHITWKPVRTVNYGLVFYEIQVGIDAPLNDPGIKTDLHSLMFWKKVPPYTELHISIRAFTYWGKSSKVEVKRYSPSSTPSAPRNLRLFVKHSPNSTENNKVAIVFRWNTPDRPNGIVRGYNIYYWANETKNVFREIVTHPALEFEAIDLNTTDVYSFKVQAFNDIGDGKMSETINTTRASSFPTLLVSSNDLIMIYDYDSRQNQTLVKGVNNPISITYLLRENTVFWINQMKELVMFQQDTSSITKIYDIPLGTPTNLVVDWLGRSLYIVVQIYDSYVVSKIDLNHFNKTTMNAIEVLRRPGEILNIQVSPFGKKLYWIEDLGEGQKLMHSSLDGSNVKSFLMSQNSSNCNCPLNNVTIEKKLSVYFSPQSLKHFVTFILTESGKVISADQNGCQCKTLGNIKLNTYLNNFHSDFGAIYWSNSNQDFLYSLKFINNNMELRDIGANDFLLYGNHIQPFPDAKCLSPSQNQNWKPEVNTITFNSLILEMPSYIPQDDCSGISIATIEYHVCYTEMNHTLCEEEKKLSTFRKDIKITKLLPYTKYNVSIFLSNYHSHGAEVKMNGPISIQTAPGAPSKPRNVTAVVLNPNLAQVTWASPEFFNGPAIYYEVHWQTDGTLSGIRKKEEQPVLDNHALGKPQLPLTSFLHKLSPNETYTVWVRAYCETNETSSDSERVKITTFAEPNALELVNQSSTFLQLAWNISQNVAKAKAEFAYLLSNEWKTAKVRRKIDDGIEQTNVFIFDMDQLKPKSLYQVRLNILYAKYNETYVWPTDSRFTFETLGDKPSPPGIPVIQYFKPNVYKIWWEPSRDNGAPIEFYRLEGLVLRNYKKKRSASHNRTVAYFHTAPSVELNEREWEIFYNGSDTSWIVNGLSDKLKYAFRVKAKNSYGWSRPSRESAEFDLHESARMADKQSAMTLVVVATCITISIVSLVTIILMLMLCKCPGKKKEPKIVHISRGHDAELAILRELPRRGIHSTNLMYVSEQPTSEDIKHLPHIKRELITLTKFLGSGAFGEVFEGRAKDLNSTDTKVAIKTLRKGASDQEKTEFLQEAQLMSHFKHEHILQLLGVCLDNDPHFIIMELMQGGDLLTYLRSSRNSPANTTTLTLIELIKMCVDVSKGCRYLEEMHFVHRDLACRNCLVSSKNSENRIVKIGDFGLARDIYKNDYYRKEGEGLLPVRWMSPESLVDGVFTSQSDVWAFGVLLWEIMTLGQQPYPARTNLEVLHYVRRGGRLGKPVGCPKELHALMLKCWEFEAENRPTFKYCLEILETLHLEKLRDSTAATGEPQYVSTVPDQNWKKGVADESNKENTPFLGQENDKTNTPKYLELIYERRESPDTCLINEGYEIPSQLTNNNFDYKISKDDGKENYCMRTFSENERRHSK